MDVITIHPVYSDYGIDANDNIITLKNQRRHRIYTRWPSYRFATITINKRQRHISAPRFIYECKMHQSLPRTHVIYVVGNRLIPSDIRAQTTIGELIRSDKSVTCENSEIIDSPTFAYWPSQNADFLSSIFRTTGNPTLLILPSQNAKISDSRTFHASTKYTKS